MEIHNQLFIPALAFGPQFPNEMRTNDHFWIQAASNSRPAGISQINNIKCMRNIEIKGSGRGEMHTKVRYSTSPDLNNFSNQTCIINFEALDTSSGYSDVLDCNTEVKVTACKYCRSAPVFDSAPAVCGRQADQYPEAVPYGRGK